eukprot:1011062-Alexandrium_andersonii.AAC.1
MTTAQAHLAPGPREPRKPWISQDTVDLINARDSIVKAGEWGDLAPRNLLINKAAKKDRIQWVERTIAESAWAP